MARAASSTAVINNDIGDQSDPVRELPPEVAKRLVVDLTRKSARDLAWLVEQEELNKTTLVNRAVQVYRLIMEAQLEGKQIVIEEFVDDNEVERSKLVLV